MIVEFPFTNLTHFSYHQNKGYDIDIDDWHKNVHYGMIDYKKYL